MTSEDFLLTEASEKVITKGRKIKVTFCHGYKLNRFWCMKTKPFVDEAIHLGLGCLGRFF